MWDSILVVTLLRGKSLPAMDDNGTLLYYTTCNVCVCVYIYIYIYIYLCIYMRVAIGFSDPYCKFKLGTQKYRSKVKKFVLLIILLYGV